MHLCVESSAFWFEACVSSAGLDLLGCISSISKFSDVFGVRGVGGFVAGLGYGRRAVQGLGFKVKGGGGRDWLLDGLIVPSHVWLTSSATPSSR